MQIALLTYENIREEEEMELLRLQTGAGM